MGEVAEVKRGEVATTSESANVLAVIERLVLDPNVDVAKVERLFDLQERILARNAEAAYNEAMAAMQNDLPEIEQHGTGNNNKYAKWEDIHEGITPVLQKHGFALTFRTGQEEGKIIVTAILRHREGHKDETTLPLPADQSGGKNAVQAVGSSVSYGKRYTASALLNIRTRGEDDDGKAASKKTGNQPGAGSVRDTVGEEQLGDFNQADHSKDPLWEELTDDLRAECGTRAEADAWWKKAKKEKLRSKHNSFAKAFHQQVVLPTWRDLPEVPF